MNLFYYLFNGFGFVVVLLVSIIVFSVLIWRLTQSDYNTKRKVIAYVAGFILLQILSYNVLLYSFPKESAVDIAPLEKLGNARITDFDEKQTELENSMHFVRKNQYAYNYRFSYHDRPSVELTAYPLVNLDTALENLLIAASVKQEDVIKLSETVYVYPAKSTYWRSRSTFFSNDLARSVNTYIVIGDVLFILRENGDRTLIGETSSRIIELICETFI